MARAAAALVLFVAACATARPVQPPAAPAPPEAREIAIDPSTCNVTSGWALAFDARREADEPAVWLLERGSGAQDLFGRWTCEIDPRPYAGKYVRVSVRTRTLGIRRAFFWLDQDGSSSVRPRVVERQLPFESEWTRQEVVLRVTADMTSLRWGAGTFEQGRMWIAEPTLEGIGTELPPPHDPLSDAP